MPRFVLPGLGLLEPVGQSRDWPAALQNVTILERAAVRNAALVHAIKEVHHHAKGRSLAAVVAGTVGGLWSRRGAACFLCFFFCLPILEAFLLPICNGFDLRRDFLFAPPLRADAPFVFGKRVGAGKGLVCDLRLY